MRLAIVGYGNLGKSLEKAIEAREDIELAAIYSRRNIDNAKRRDLTRIGSDNDFDAALIALGSYKDAQAYANLYAKFDTVDSFDTHAVIQEYKQSLTSLNGDRIAIVGAGWDPGVLSLMRGTLSMGSTPVTVWGRGISQGHSNAIRAIDGVLDAVQFTAPKSDYYKLIHDGVTDGKQLHTRECYVACVESDRENVRREIESMPNYFEGYATTVNFVSTAEVRKLKRDTSHRGQIFCIGDGYEASASLSLTNNADLTAHIMLSYAKALPALKRDGYRGALDVFDIPLKYIANSAMI